MPLPKGLHTGIPMGQPNSTVLMSSPMRLRSSEERLFNQSRTGSPPASVRKKIAGTRLPCFSSASDCSLDSDGDLGLLPTIGVYHIRYSRGKWLQMAPTRRGRRGEGPGEEVGRLGDARYDVPCHPRNPPGLKRRPGHPAGEA